MNPHLLNPRHKLFASPVWLTPLLALITVALFTFIFTIPALAQDGSAGGSPAIVLDGSAGSAAAATPAVLPVSVQIFMAVVAFLTALVGLARVIVKLTPTPDDDTKLEKFVEFLKHIGLHIGVYFILGLLLFATGCSSFNANVYNAEKLAKDSAVGATHSFNVYYAAATNGASPSTLTNLNSFRASLYDADRKLSASLLALDDLRLAYKTNASASNKVAVRLALDNVTGQSSNVVSLTKTVPNLNQ